MSKIVAILPAKQNSGRLPGKNFLQFVDGLSLLELKVRQCLESGVFDKVFISSDADEAQSISKRFSEDEVGFLRREERLCVDETPWGEVIKGVAQSTPVDDDDYLMWIHVTNPLFNRFRDIVSELNNNSEYDSVSTVTGHRHFMLNADHIPINHVWGPWHAYSQGIKPVFQLNFASSLVKKKVMIDNRYILGDRPKFYEISAFEGLDIDTPEEFEMAKVLYTHRRSTVK